MGAIFAAYDEELKRTVAMKVIAGERLGDSASRRLFLREARAAAALDHPFICTVHEVLEHQGQPVIVMERVEGETLANRISRGALDVREQCQYGIEIAEALAAAHARDIVHRDVKSGNVMVTVAGHVKVMDFGLAEIVAASPTDDTEHVSQQLTRAAGTLPYMAPELLRGERAAAASDLYALGVILYEMATRRRPFSGATDAVLISEILNREPTPARQLDHSVPAPLDELISRLLTKQPSRRPSTSEVIGRLTEIREPQQGKERRSLAVLPFRSLVADSESAHLGVGLADATTSELALVRSLLVRPTATILRFADRDPIEAGRELRVDAVVAGTFQRAGSRLRVSVQLIDVAEERPLWSTKVDTTFDDVFAMQDEVSRKVVEALQLELTPADEQQLGKRVQATGDVLDLWLKGRVALCRESVSALNEAVEFFEQARNIDPKNPLPWLGLADAYSRLAFTWDPDGGWHERAKEMCDRALLLDPRIPEGHYILARLAWTPQRGFEHEYAMKEVASALAERPNLNEGWDLLGLILFHVGLLDDARALDNRALAINPEDGLVISHIAWLETYRGNYQEALMHARRVSNSNAAAHSSYLIAINLLHLDDLAGAEKNLDEASRKFPGLVLYHSARAIAAAARGNESAARRHIELTVQNRKAFGHFHHAEFDVACALATLGHHAEAMQWLTSAVRDGFPSLGAVETNRFLAPLRGRADYETLIDELRSVRDHYRTVFTSVRGKLSTA